MKSHNKRHTTSTSHGVTPMSKRKGSGRRRTTNGSSSGSKDIGELLEGKKWRHEMEQMAEERKRLLAEERRRKLDVARYERQVKAARFVTGYEYGEYLRPSADIMSYLGVEQRKGESELELMQAGAIRVWIPDTLVVSSEKVVWLYTCSKGILRSTTNFAGKHIMEQFGDVEYPKQIVAVQKMPKYNGPNGYTGNEVVALDSEDLFNVLSLETDIPMSKESHGRPGGTSNPMVIQRFVKSKGLKSHIIRTNWQWGKRTVAWTISNSTRFDDPNAHEGNKLFNQMKTPFGVNIVKLSELATKEPESVALAVRHGLEHLFGGRPLQQLVVDCIRDDRNQLWFLQVHAYRLVNPKVQHNLALRLGLLDNEEGDGDSDQDVNGGLGTLGHHLILGTGGDTNNNSSNNNNKGSPFSGGNNHDDSPSMRHGNNTTKEELKRQKELERLGLRGVVHKCKFCGQSYQESETPYIMTTQMIMETSTHLKTRWSKERYVTTFGHQSSGDLNLDISRLYHAHFVCETCYKVYQNEARLAKISRNLATNLGISIPPLRFAHSLLHISPEEMKGLPIKPRRLPNPTSPTAAGKAGRLSPTGKKRPLSPIGGASTRQQCSPTNQSRKSPRSPANKSLGAGSSMRPVSVGSPKSPGRHHVDGPSSPSGFDRGGLILPQNVTMCRIMLALHDLHKLPDSLYSLEETEGLYYGEPLYEASFHFNLFGIDYEIPVDLANEINRNVVSIKQMRLFTFFSEATPIFGALPEATGMALWLKEHPEIILELKIRPRFPKSKAEDKAKLLGKCHVPLAQFKSALLKRTDMMVPLGYSSELTELRLSIGLERTRSNFNSTSIASVQMYEGVYIPEPHFFSCDPLPDDWVFCITNNAHQGSLQRERKSFRQLPNIAGRITKKATSQLRLALPKHEESSTDSYCFQVTIHAARHLRLEYGWPRSLYLQYNLFGVWYTTPIVDVSSEDDGFAFEFKKKHYFRLTTEELQSKIEHHPGVNFALMSPLNRLESFLYQLIMEIMDRLGYKISDCLQREKFLQQLEIWAAQVQNLPPPSTSKKNETPFKSADVDHDNIVPYLANLPKHLRVIWKGFLQETITWEEILFLSFVVVRLFKVFSVELSSEENDFSCVDQIKRLHERMPRITHPSFRKVIEAELVDKVDQFIRKFFEAMEDHMHVMHEKNMVQKGFQWTHVLDALAFSFRAVEVEPIRESFQDLDAYCHRQLLVEQNEDRLAFACHVDIESFLDGDDTIDGTYTVLKFSSDYTAPQLIHQGSNVSSVLPSEASTSTCSFSSMDEEEQQQTQQEEEEEQEEEKRYQSDEDFESETSWWEKLQPLIYGEGEEYDVGDILDALQDDSEEEVPADVKASMLNVVQGLLEAGKQQVTLHELLDEEKKQLKKPTNKESETKAPEHVPETSTSPKPTEDEFPPYLHVNLVLYPSIYIVDEKSCPYRQEDTFEVTQTEQVQTFFDKLRTKNE